MKRNLKKVCVLTMAVVLVFMFVGCGTQDSSTSSSNNTEKEGATDTNTSSDSLKNNSEDKIVLKLSHHCTEDDSNHLLFVKFAELVNQKTNGKVEIDIYPNGQLAGQKEALEGLKLGTIDMAMSDTALWSNYDPSTGILDMPYVFDSRQHAIDVTTSDVIDVLRDKLVKVAGIRPITVQCLHFRNAILSKDNVNSFEDFKKLKVRTPESPPIIEAFKAFGASPIVIPSGEAYTAIQTGVADGMEGHAEYLALQKIYEVAQNYVLTQHTMTFTALNMSEKVYQTLPNDVKTAMDEAATEALTYFYDYTDKLFDEKFKYLEDQGVTIKEVDLEPFKASVKPYVDNFLKEYQLEDLYEEIQNQIK